MIRFHMPALVLASLLAWGAAPPAAGAQAAAVPPITATLNGRPLTLAPPAREIAGRLYLPLRALVAALQIRVKTGGGHLALLLPDHDVLVTIGQATVESAGRKIDVGSPVIQTDGTTLVPLRFVSAALGAQVSFDARARTVSIVSVFAGASEAPPTQNATAGRQVSGTVSAVDRNSQPPTVTVLQNNVPQTISMTSQAKIVLQDVSVHTTFAGTLADIQPGDELTASIDGDGSVHQVVDFFASHAGGIAAVSGSTFVLKDGQVVTPPGTSVVTLNGVATSVGELKVGDRVTLRFNPQTNEVKAVIASRPSAGTPSPDGAVHITSFVTDAARPLRAGQTLSVTMVGTPGGTATFDLGPIVKGLPMAEVAPGHYRGSLPIGEGLNLTDISVFGELVVNGVTAPRAEAPTQLSVATTPPQISDIAPMGGEGVNNDRPNIFATFTSPTQIGIDVHSVRIVVNGRDVTAQANVNPDFVVYMPGQALAPGPVNVSVSVADAAGNVASRSWSFVIRSSQ
ncbi:copper amine oxidase N-terminal domain-containing protein [bacterium]|nr:MAG: copper amine oxidase N-terminal domain-containing protein [bacterium]